MPYLWLDAVYEKIREGGQVKSRAVVLAIGVTASGHRQVLGIEVGNTESEAFWRDFLREILASGELAAVASPRTLARAVALAAAPDADAEAMQSIVADAMAAIWPRRYRALGLDYPDPTPRGPIP